MKIVIVYFLTMLKFCTTQHTGMFYCSLQLYIFRLLQIAYCFRQSTLPISPRRMRLTTSGFLLTLIELNITTIVFELFMLS